MIRGIALAFVLMIGGCANGQPVVVQSPFCVAFCRNAYGTTDVTVPPAGRDLNLNVGPEKERASGFIE